MTSSFTPGELEIMKILWDYGEQKPSEIQGRYPRSIKNAALRFQLKVLLEKGHIRRRKVGKAYYYKAVTARNGTFRKMARRMAEIYCRGSTVGLIGELIRAERLTAEEIQELTHLTEIGETGDSTKKGDEDK